VYTIQECERRYTVLKAINSFLSIFKSSTGNYDMGRILAFKCVTAFSAAFLWSVFRLQAVPNWTELGGGYALVMGGAMAFIAGKEVAIAKAGSITNAV
jgi:hypothetical protein